MRQQQIRNRLHFGLVEILHQILELGFQMSLGTTTKLGSPFAPRVLLDLERVQRRLEVVLADQVFAMAFVVGLVQMVDHLEALGVVLEVLLVGRLLGVVLEVEVLLVELLVPAVQVFDLRVDPVAFLFQVEVGLDLVQVFVVDPEAFHVLAVVHLGLVDLVFVEIVA